MIIVNGWKPLTIITKHSILDVAASLDTPLPILQVLSRSKAPPELKQVARPFFQALVVVTKFIQ